MLEVGVHIWSCLFHGLKYITTIVGNKDLKQRYKCCDYKETEGAEHDAFQQSSINIKKNNV